MSIQIKFCGAAGTVTGSCFWIQTDNSQFLVDCGLFQGSKTIKELNYRDFPFDPRDIDFVLLTHAHTDHTALIPKLMKAGFKGPVYATPATCDLMRYMLPDSGYIQESEVYRLNRRNTQRGRATVEPIYTRAEAEDSIRYVKTIDYQTWLNPASDIRVKFWNAGHILGSASIEIEITQDKKCLRLLFSGDLGPENKLFHQGPDAPKDFNYVFCESTYGGRDRADVSVAERRDILAREINDALKSKGNLIIPSFAVERSQELLLDISYLLHNDAISCSAVFLDSPLAIKITSVFAAHAGELENTKNGFSPFTHPSFHFTETTEESKSIARFSGGAIIMAASGMCDAGRIRHHLKNYLWRSDATLLLTGYQAVGTLGSLLESGLKTIKIQGEAITVRARIRKLDHYSGHADQEGLVDWITERLPIRKALFLIHGSEKALQQMKTRLLKEDHIAPQIIIPNIDDEYDLPFTGKAAKKDTVKRRLAPHLVDKPDWHNELAQLTLDIRKNLENAPDGKFRSQLLQKLHRALK